MVYYNSILDEVAKICQQFGFANTYWLGFSGGMDSQVLLHVLLELKKHVPLKIKTIHINHQLSSNAESWVTHCQHYCARMEIDLLIKQVTTRPKKGESVEAWARAARYKIFENCLDENEILLTAHHADDQAETLISQMMRGAGIKGLAAMPAMKSLGRGFLVRPLLKFTRHDLQKFANQYQLHWVQDASNNNLKFSRNYIRHNILPILQTHWPQYVKLLCRVTKNCADAQFLLEEYLSQDLAFCSGDQPQTLSISKLKNLSTPRQCQVIRYWLQSLFYPMPSQKKLTEILLHVLPAALDRSPVVRLAKCEIRRFQDNLYALPPQKNFKIQEIFAWPNLSENLNLPIGVLSAERVLGRGLIATLKDCKVKFRSCGERCQLPGLKFHYKLKKLLLDLGVPPWLRDQVPLLFYQEELVSVVGFFIADKYKVKKGDYGYELVLKSF